MLCRCGHERSEHRGLGRCTVPVGPFLRFFGKVSRIRRVCECRYYEAERFCLTCGHRVSEHSWAGVECFAVSLRDDMNLALEMAACCRCRGLRVQEAALSTGMPVD